MGGAVDGAAAIALGTLPVLRPTAPFPSCLLPIGPGYADAWPKACVGQFQAQPRPGGQGFADAWPKACVRKFQAQPRPGGPGFADAWR